MNSSDIPSSTKTSILVLCTGNSCRSQMAEGYFRHFGGDRVDAHSAGLEPHGLNPGAIKVMAEDDIDITTHTSKHLGGYLGRDFDYVITVCDNAADNCPTFPGNANRLHWPFEDPAGAIGAEEEVLELFRKVRDQIKTKIKTWLEEQGI